MALLEEPPKHRKTRTYSLLQVVAFPIGTIKNHQQIQDYGLVLGMVSYPVNQMDCFPHKGEPVRCTMSGTRGTSETIARFTYERYEPLCRSPCRVSPPFYLNIFVGTQPHFSIESKVPEKSNMPPSPKLIKRVPKLTQAKPQDSSQNKP